MPPTATSYPLELTLPSPLAAATRRLEALGGRCRVVGGSVRDALLGLEPKDFDVEVYGLPLEAIAAGLSALGKTDLVGRSFAVVKLWTQGAEYDFSVPRRERKTGSGHRAFDVIGDPTMSEQEALSRRDFTINALLYDPARREVLDYFGGYQDLQRKTLRHVGPAFAEDPLRVLRAMQFAGRFSLTLHPSTATLCQSMRQEFWSLPKERIWGEWEKWSGRSQSLSAGMRALEVSGWLPFFPELNALIGLPQDPEWHPEGDAWIHTLCCLDALAEKSDWPSLPQAQRSLLAFAVLCHDLGKARCTRYAEKRGRKRWISPGHESESVWLGEQFMARIGAPKAITQKLANLVGNHHFLNTHAEGGPSPASLRRLARRLYPATSAELLYVMQADHRGRPPLLSPSQETRLQGFAAGIKETELDIGAPRPILLGRHLIELGHQPGRTFKAYLDDGYEAQLDGAFADEAGARAWLLKRLSRDAQQSTGSEESEQKASDR